MLTDGEKGVIVQRDRTTYAVAPHTPCGIVTPEILRRIADVAEKYDCRAMKVTGAGRIALLGLKEEDIDAIWSDLGMDSGSVVGICVRSIKACPGISHCKRGQQDSLSVGMQLDEKYHGMQMPGKMKMGISGCPNQCAEGRVPCLTVEQMNGTMRLPCRPRSDLEGRFPKECERSDETSATASQCSYRPHPVWLGTTALRLAF
jgi:NAD(P)H-nitrite reductase large subunit